MHEWIKNRQLFGIEEGNRIQTKHIESLLNEITAENFSNQAKDMKNCEN
jgi:hypothetical protein